MKCAVCICLLFVSSLCLPPSLQAQEEEKVHEVTPGYFEVVETVDAVVESRQMTPLTPDTEAWTTLKIESLVDEGTTVEAGQKLGQFETRDLDRKLEATRQEIQQSELGIESLKLEVDLMSSTIDLDRELAERKYRVAEEDYKYFVDVDRPNSERSARRNVENSEFQLEYASEEFNQLKRMYDEDELTEESEEIVLKRTERDVRNAQYYLEQARLRADKTLGFDLPRELEQKTDALRRAELEKQRAEISLPIELDKKRLALDKARFEIEKTINEYEQLKSDREKMELVAPAAGIVYYGECVRGKWVGQSGAQRNLEAGKSVAPEKVLVTIVNLDDLMLRASLTERQLALVSKLEDASVQFPAFLNASSPVEIQKISPVPISDDAFDCQMDFANTPAGLMPGMTGKVRLVVRQSDSALTVPESAVFTDDGITHYVFVSTGDETSERRTVTIGLSADKKTEVLEGLKAGEKVLLERPAA